MTARPNLLLLILVLVVFSSPAKADLLGLVAGKTIDRTIVSIDAALNRLVDKLDGKADKYIGRFESLVDKTRQNIFQDADNLRIALKGDLLELENEIFSDLTSAMWDAECTAIRSADYIFKKSAVGAVNKILNANPAITLSIFGVDIGQLVGSVGDDNGPTPSTISAAQIYHKIKEATLRGAELYIEEQKEQANAYVLYSAYVEISRLALETLCHYQMTADRGRYEREHFIMTGLADDWNAVVNVKFAQQ